MISYASFLLKCERISTVCFFSGNDLRPPRITARRGTQCATGPESATRHKWTANSKFHGVAAFGCNTWSQPSRCGLRRHSLSLPTKLLNPSSCRRTERLGLLPFEVIIGSAAATAFRLLYIHCPARSTSLDLDHLLRVEYSRVGLARVLFHILVSRVCHAKVISFVCVL